MYKATRFICQICGIEFNAKAKNRKFCSPEHSDIGRSQKITKTCLTCGIEFKVKPSREGKYHNKECWYKSDEYKKWTTNPEYSKAKADNARRIGRKNKGNIAWNRGIPQTQEVKEAISQANKGKLIDENNPNWKGKNVGEQALHSYIIRRLGKPKKCDFCGTTNSKKYEWANKTGKYLRDLSDWYRLCRKCHFAYDQNRIGETKIERKKLFQERKKSSKSS